MGLKRSRSIYVCVCAFLQWSLVVNFYCVGYFDSWSTQAKMYRIGRI